MEKSKINWYDGEELAIFFDKMPNVTMRYVTPFTTDEEKKEINKKPFINLSELKVIIQDKIELASVETCLCDECASNIATLINVYKISKKNK